MDKLEKGKNNIVDESTGKTAKNDNTEKPEKVITILFAPQFDEKYFDLIYDKFITLTDTDKLIEYIGSNQSAQSDYSKELAEGIFFDRMASSEDTEEALKKTPTEILESFLYQTAKYFFGFSLLNKGNSIKERNTRQ